MIRDSIITQLAETLPVRPDLIPEELKSVPQWVCWKLIAQADGKEPRKIPINPRTGETADISNPNTWGSFDEAYTAYRKHGYKGVWLALTQDLGLTAWDFDECIAGGEIPTWLIDIISKLASYTETSPSGEGIRVICRGKLPEGKRRTKYQGVTVEVYDNARFISLTGAVLDGTSQNIEARQAEIEAVYQQIFASNKARTTPRQPERQDTDTLEHAMERDRLFRALWSGVDFQTLGYPSQSEADAALMSKLWFWTGGDREQTLRLFRQSPYGQRAKAQREDYVERTLEAASHGDVYQPRRNGKQQQKDEPTLAPPPPDLSQVIRPLNTVEARPVEWLVPNFLARGEITILAGEAGIGKTTLALEIIHGLTRGQPILDRRYQPIRAKCCWMHFDHGEERLREKYEYIYGEPPHDNFLTPDLHEMDRLGMLPLSAQTLEMWVSLLTAHKVEVLVIDTLLDLFQLDDVDKTAKVQTAMQSLRKLVERTGVAVLAIAHPSKGTGLRRVTSLANSIAFGAKADVVAFLADDTETPHPSDNRCILRVVKNRSGNRWEAALEKRAGHFVPVPGENGRPPTLSERILDYIETHGPATRQTLLTVFYEVSESTLDRQVKALVKRGILREARTGRNNLHRVYFLPHQSDEPHMQTASSHYHHYICDYDEIDENDENGLSSLCNQQSDNKSISSISSFSSCIYERDEIENGAPAPRPVWTRTNVVTDTSPPTRAGGASSCPSPQSVGVTEERGGVELDFHSLPDRIQDDLAEFGDPLIPPERFLLTRRRGVGERCTLHEISSAYARWCRGRGGRPVTHAEFLVALRRVATVRRAPGRPAEAICVEGISVEEERLSLKRAE